MTKRNSSNTAQLAPATDLPLAPPTDNTDNAGATQAQDQQDGAAGSGEPVATIGGQDVEHPTSAPDAAPATDSSTEDVSESRYTTAFTIEASRHDHPAYKFNALCNQMENKIRGNRAIIGADLADDMLQLVTDLRTLVTQ
jgi:hypothetical protein